MQRIEQPMMSLKNIIIENDVVFGQKLFLLMTPLMMTSSTQDQNL